MSTTNNPVVRAAGLTKVFRDFWGRPKARAVNDIDFEIHQGEVVGLLGPNGSGKSTTVKMILGLLYPTGGQISVLGRSPRAVETKREIGYLPEESYLYKYLTAEETLDFFGALFNLSKEERKRRIDQLLDMVGMAHARRRRVGEFSKGMARRIGLAQAMINDPEFLILDEPTSGLDPLGCREVKDLIMALKRRGKTVVVTSHLLSDIEDICDRVIILYGGKIRATGTLNELLTVKQETRIVTPELPPEAMKKMLELLRANFKDGEFSVDHPHRSLESYFLDVIEQAKAESVETAGVVSGGQIAEYLTADDPAAAALQSLLDEDKPAARQEPAPAAEPAAVDAAEVLEDKIGALADDEPRHAAAEVQEADEEARRNLEAADEKLADLLGKNK
ncbi:MAG: ABC transporter ATP-binding protein [Lentisphaeria bacterium]|nr:ABC transporter ATP-binding protein [Lentisphaeria bacterium]